MRGVPDAARDQQDFWDDPVLSIGIWYLPNLVFGRNVKTRPNWEATIILADSREINSPRGLG
jgi:hypothetical protein